MCELQSINSPTKQTVFQLTCSKLHTELLDFQYYTGNHYIDNHYMDNHYTDNSAKSSSMLLTIT